MADPHRIYEIRCPVYGFIPLNDWEREIISQPAFQRLRRIRQLAWTDYVYPGALHSRFEHVLGVMHMATLLYDQIVQRSKDLLRTELAYNEAGLQRDRTLVRLAALLHDVGHAPFSHAAEELFPQKGSGPERFRHEDYSAAIVRQHFRAAIEDHPLNRNYGFRAEDIAALLEGSTDARNAVFWRELIVGQLDADRIDYLLRDSLHAGVDYGRFDWRRLLHTVEAVQHDEGRGPRLGVGEGGWHAAEGLILARYFMFTQVYFHKTRVAFDHHFQRALLEMLPGGSFPRPDGADLDRYLTWDDWRVFGLLGEGKRGEHGRRLACRDHFREVYHTPETPSQEDLDQLDRARAALGPLLAAEEHADKSWYKVGPADIPVLGTTPPRKVWPLSRFSAVVGNLRPIQKVLLYSRPEDLEAGRGRLESIQGAKHE